MDIAYSITVEGYDGIEIMDWAKTFMNRKFYNDVKRVNSIEVNGDVTKRPMVRTTLGLGAIDKKMRVQKNLREQRKNIKKQSVEVTGGTVNGDAQISDEGAMHGNVYLDYYEDPERAVSLGDQSVGDWWGMNLVINVTAFDADNLAISLVANAEMWNVAAIPYDQASVSNLPKKNLSMTASNVELSQVKSILSRNVAGKITRK